MARDRMLEINPINIKGSRFTGWALDYHTVSSKYDKAGRYYITDRTPLGELLYKFKYKRQFWLTSKIARTAVDFLESRGIKSEIDFIVTIPPAKFRLLFQPVKLLGRKIGQILGRPVKTDLLKRKKKIPPLKSMEDKIERAKIVKGLFAAKSGYRSDTTALLFDDLYRSGATLNEAAETLLTAGCVRKIVVLTITKTKVRR